MSEDVFFNHPRWGKLRGRIAKQFLNGPGTELKCPYCGSFTSALNSIQSCPSCYRKWVQIKGGKYVFYNAQTIPDDYEGVL